MPGLKGPVVETKYWHRLEDGRVQCDVCPRFCTLQEGQRGLCFVRACEGEQIVLTTYGRSSGFCVDPIEKKPLNHFLPGRRFSPSGRRAAISPASSARTGTSASPARSTRSPTRRRRRRSRAPREQLGCRSVAFTYNDPAIFLEYAIDVAEACRERGHQGRRGDGRLHLRRAAPENSTAHMDAANVDLKAFTEEFYRDVHRAHLAAGARDARLPEAARRTSGSS